MTNESFVQGNPHSSTVICTCWTLAKPISQNISQDAFAVCANLYSFDGLNTIARAFYQNPHWCNLVLFGADLTHGGETLVQFFTHGLDEQGKVKNTSFSFQKEIPRDALERLRKNVRVHDLRGKTLEELSSLIQTLPNSPAWTTPQTFPESPLPQVETFPSEKFGFSIRGKTPSHAWLQILDVVLKFGEEKQTEYGGKMKELIDIMAIISGDDETIPECFPFDEKALEEYLPKLLSSQKPENVVYTYGSRLREGIDQIQHAVEYLKKTPHTRRASVFTWRINEDLNNKNPPCLTQITWNVTGGKLQQTCVFRSHDIFEGWPLNLMGLRLMHQHVSREANIPIGDLACLSISAHIYEKKWDEAKAILKKYHAEESYRFNPDPRGNFVIKINPETKKINIQHFTPMGEKTQFTWENTHVREKQALEELFAKLAHSNFILNHDHALYLGAELQKAITAMKTGQKYVQDKELE